MNSVDLRTLKDSIGVNQSIHTRLNSNQNSISSYTILEELPTSIEEYSEDDVILYAKQIGIDPRSEPDLLWIAKKGLVANLPDPWIPVEDHKRRLYYFNTSSKESSWEHPCDGFYRSLVEQERLKGSSTTLSMSGLTSFANLHFVDEELLFKGDNNLHYDNEKKAENNEIKSKEKRHDKSQDEEEVESLDFELDIDAALEDLSFASEENEELVTIDVTEGGTSDTKQYKELHTIQLNSSQDKELSSKVFNDINKSKNDTLRNNESVKNKVEVMLSSSSSSPGHQQLEQKKSRDAAKPNNEVLDDEFLLDVGDEDPFADFASDDRNTNDLFRSSSGASENNDSVQAKATASKSLIYPTVTQPTPKPLETLVETSEKEEFGVQSNQLLGVKQLNQEEEEEEVEDEDQTPDEDNEIDDDANDNWNLAEIESKFAEITDGLSHQIEELRNELRQEVKKQRNAINKEIKDNVSQLEAKVNRNEKDLSETIEEIAEIKRTLNTALNTSQSLTSITNREDYDKNKMLTKEMQILNSELREECMQSIRDLRNEVTKNIKSKINTVSDQMEDKFMELREENRKDMSSIRNEVNKLNDNNKSIAQNASQLRDDLSLKLEKVEKQQKEQSRNFDKMILTFGEHKEKVDDELQRIRSEMIKEENKIKESKNEESEMRSLAIKASERYARELSEKIDRINGEHDKLKQQVDKMLEMIHFNKEEMQKHQQTNNNDANLVEDEEKMGETDLNLENKITAKIASLEDCVKHVCNKLEQMIPILDSSQTQNRNNRKQDLASSKIKILQFSEDDDYISKSSSSLFSSETQSSSSSEINDNNKASKKSKRIINNKKKDTREGHKSCCNKIEMPSFHPHYYCCQHNDNHLPNRNYQFIKVPLMKSPSWDSNHSKLRDIRASSSSLLNLIKKTSKKLKEEAMELENMGNYRFTSDFGTFIHKDNDDNNDDAAIKKLKLVRVDVDDKLRRLTNAINQQKSSQI